MHFDHTKINKPLNSRRSHKNNNKMLRRRDRFTDFAGAIADKARIDAAWLDKDNKDHFYNVEAVTDPELESRLVVLDADDETMDFIRNSVDKSDCVVTQMWHTAAKSVLGWFWAKTDINGVLGRGSMFVFSKAQLETLLQKERQPTAATNDPLPFFSKQCSWDVVSHFIWQHRGISFP